MARIILVDDDQEILILGRALLAQAGHDVLTATGALEAVEHLRNYGCDLLITDVNMPTHSGYDLVRTVRGDKRWARLPVAMLTGRRDRRDIERALELGVDDYILKPIDPMLLLKKVETLLLKTSDQEKAPELDFARANFATRGTLGLQVEMRSVSELGVVVTCAHKLTEGAVISLQTDLFTEIGCDPPPMKVLSSVQLSNGVYETRVMFVGAEEAVLQKIRSWIYSHGSKASRKPA